MKDRETYLQHVLRLYQARLEEIAERGVREPTVFFLGRHSATLIDELHQRWEQTRDKSALPTPAQVLETL